MGRMAQGSGGRMAQGGYGAYNAYISAATRYAAAGAPTLYDHPGSSYESKLHEVHLHLQSDYFMHPFTSLLSTAIFVE